MKGAEGTCVAALSAFMVVVFVACLAPLPDPSAPSPDASADSATGVCDAGLIACDGACVDPLGAANCGGCGVQCTTNRCGVSVAADMRTMPAGWLFNGSATLSGAGESDAGGHDAADESDVGAADAGAGAVLVPAGGNHEVGSILYGEAIVADEFTATFEFRIGFGGGTTRGDGMGFMIETNGPTAVGRSGAGLGMSGLTGYGAELDIYDNMLCGDTNNNHVGIDALALCESTQVNPTSLYESGNVSNYLDLADGQWHEATIALQAGTMSVAIDSIPLADQTLTGWVDGVAYYFGFAASQGGPGEYQAEVTHVVITFPTPRCL
jgi:Bacterial lectin